MKRTPQQRMPEGERDGRPKQRTGEHVARIVRPGGNAGHAQRHRHDQRHDAHLPMAEQQRNRDGERGRRVIARKRWIVGCGDEQMGVMRVSDVRARALPDVSSNLGYSQPNGKAKSSGDDTMTTVDRPPLSSCKEHGREQGDEEHLALQGEEPQRVLDAIVVVGEAVENLVGLEVDADSLRIEHRSFASAS
jgi:hypothetical protein